MIDTERLLAPVSDDDACGPDLEYDPDFQALEQAARGVPEQEIGRQADGTPIRRAGVPPDWNEVRERAESLLARSKDLRVAIRLAQAATEQEGLAGLAEGLALVHGILEQHWDGFHPRLEDDGDATLRLNALQLLADPQDFLRSVRTATVAPPVRAGRVTVRGVMLALGHAQPGPEEGVPSPAEVEGLLGQSAEANSGALDAPGRVIAAVDSLRAVFDSKLGDDRANDFRPLRDLVKPAADLCARLSGAGGTSEDASDASGSAAGGNGHAGGAASGAIRTREDAVRELERVCAFIEQTEPSHPAPLLIRRAQRLLRMNFLEIMQELAPDSVGTIQNIAGNRSE